MKVKISVVGSSIVYLQNNIWNVVFITDTCHDVKFDNPNNSAPTGPLARRSVSREIDFFAEGATGATQPGQSVVDDFLNMSSSIMHKTRPSGLSNLDQVLNLQGGRQYIHMKIPYGSLSVTSYTTNEYFVEPYESGLPKGLGRAVASAFAITFDVISANPLTMTIKDRNGSAQHPFASRPFLELPFDNYCDQASAGNDFINYYDWLYDIRSTTPGKPIRFVAGKIPRVGSSPSEENAPDSEEVMVSSKSKITGLQGDCDPVIVEPPPG